MRHCASSRKVAGSVPVHDITAKNDRLAAIRLIDPGACSKCGHPDSLQHRVIECGQDPIVRNWTRHKMGIILRMDHKYIQQEWILRPAFLLTLSSTG